jgi:CO/xanthine dehydrogenase Mo-binding subunit
MVSSRIKNPDLAAQIDKGQIAWYRYISPITEHYCRQIASRDYRGKRLAYWGHITSQNTLVMMLALKQTGAEMVMGACNVDSTDNAAFSTGAVASRGAYSNSNAICAAVCEAREVLFSSASSKFEVTKADLDYREGVIYCKKDPEKRLTIGEVTNYAMHTLGMMVIGHGSFIGELSSPNPETGACNPFRTLAWCAIIAEVEVDTDTGEITMLKLVSAYDVGKVLHKGMVTG